MKALSVLYGGGIEAGSFAFEKLPPGNESAFSLALSAAGRFPGAQKTVLLGIEGGEYPGLPPGVSVILRPSWTKKGLLEELARLAEGFDLFYFAWADCPLLDPVLAGAIADRHLRYAAEYSYADGWPYGFAPELLAPLTPVFLLKILGDDDGSVERDSLFSVLQKDINAFDIETEISPVDLRFHRLSLAADSKRNHLLLRRFREAGLKSADEAADLIEKQPGLLRTLPAYFNVQVSGGCPQACSLCPWPKAGSSGNEPVTSRRDFMGREKFEALLDSITAFAGDAVIGLSLWGELSLHPEKTELIKAVLARPALGLVIESSGIGWKEEELEEIAAEAKKAAVRENSLLADSLSWIISLDAYSASRYREIRGPGFSEALECAKKLLSLFPRNAYVQAVRVKDFEDDIEQFYRSWKDADVPGAVSKNSVRHIIIQKYDDFCGVLPRLQASDLSPVKRSPCWHNMRDMAVLLDGSVPQCREDLSVFGPKGEGNFMGNVFIDSLEEIWKRGEALYLSQTNGTYSGVCAGCDEYYTYNF